MATKKLKDAELETTLPEEEVVVEGNLTPGLDPKYDRPAGEPADPDLL
jgi:hypothetical protein